MIAFRQVDGRYPLVWETADQPEGRWHAAGEGPAHYFADTPDAAWAEFLRHEEITDAEDLATVRRQMWAVEIGPVPNAAVNVPLRMLGGRETYAACQEASRELRANAAGRPGTLDRLAAPCAALKPGGTAALVFVVYDAPADFVGWIAGDEARPAADLLERVRHYGSA